MKTSYSYLKNQDFLKLLAGLPVELFFVKIVILSWDEEPLLNILGKVISASINIDGQSAVRRTATISLIADEMIKNITNVKNLLSINKKVAMEIGYINTTGKYVQYDMLWFPLGIYVILSSSISHTADGLTISLQLSDKMCLLDGQCGGTFPASVVLDNYETIDENGEAVVSRPTIYQIIRLLVNHWGGEQLGKIIIADLDTRVKQVMKWVGSAPLYFLHDSIQDQYLITINEELATEALNNKSYNYKFVQAVLSNSAQEVRTDPFEYGEDVGYVLTDFSYPGDLITNAGDTVASVLETIKNTLGNYEYFYDLDGNFVFQEIKNYLNTSLSEYVARALANSQLVPDYVASLAAAADLTLLDRLLAIDAYLTNMSHGKAVFEFNDSNLISSYSNSPQYVSIKNDFLVWGIRKTSDGYEYPIRYHLAIDEKPDVGTTYTAFPYTDPDENIQKWHMPVKFSSKSNFPQTGAAGVYYLDTAEGKIYRWMKKDDAYNYVQIGTKSDMKNVTTTDWRTLLYFQGVTALPYGTESNYYYTELLNEWPKIYDIKPDTKDANGKTVNNSCFKSLIINNPTTMDYYLDFIDSTAAAGLFSVNNIGRRTMVMDLGNNVNCIFEPWIPDIILIGTEMANKTTIGAEKLREECNSRGLTYCQVNDDIYSNLMPGGTLYSAYQSIRQAMHQYTSYNESISLQTLPIYTLEPNTRISVYDPDSNIYGDYMIDSLSINLGINSTLTINASKALEKI